MIGRSFFGFVQVAGVLLFTACSNDREVGTTSETENVLTARVFRVDSILPTWNRPDSGATVATLRLNQKLLDFEKTDSVGRDLRLQRADGSDIPFEIVYWDKPGKRGRLRVRIDSPAVVARSIIRLSWQQPLASRSDTQATWRGISYQRRVAIGTYVIDDFEDADLASNLPSQAKWYTAASESSTVSVPVVGADPIGTFGKELQVTYTADSAKYRYVVVGLDLGPGSRSLRGMDSLFLRVRGSGRLSVSLDRLGGAADAKAWYHLNLGPTWTDLVLHPDDFLPPGSPTINVGWEGIKDSVTNFTFLLSGGTEFHLDVVRIHGLDRDDFR